MIAVEDFQNALDACSVNATAVVKPATSAQLPSTHHVSDDATTAERCLKSLKSSRADDYQQWIEVGMAMKAAGCDVSVWDMWSRQSSKYQEGVCQSKWNSFNSDGKLTIASLIHWAKLDNPNYSPPAATKLSMFPFTDSGSAERFVAMFGNEFRYNHTRGRWYCWDGRRWDESRGEPGARNYFVKMCRELRREALLPENQDRREAIERFARQSENTNKITNALHEAQHIEPISCYAEDFNRDPWAFNVQNGTIDLTTGKLRPHNPADMLSQIANVVHNPNAKCPIFDKSLFRITGDNAAMVDYILRVFGYSLTGSIAEQVFWAFWGHGKNGKTTVLTDNIRLMMGDYACECAGDLLIVNFGNAHPTELADLLGKRLVIASETEKDKTLKVQLVKKLTGDSSIKARYMRQDFFEFQRQFKIILVTNNKPKIPENTIAIWRRVKLVPFNVVISDAECDLHLSDKLRLEWPGILNRLIEGCLGWQQTGLKEPEDVSTATTEYRTEQDPLKDFFDECCTIDGFSITPVSILKERYERWCKDAGTESHLSAQDFNTCLRQKGCRNDQQWYDGKTQRVWIGLNLT